MTGAYKAIIKLREEKVIKAIGVGVNDQICVQDLQMRVILIVWSCRKIFAFRSQKCFR